MSFNFFKEKPEPTESSETESKKADEYAFIRQHLPDELFPKMQELGLLDGQVKTFTLSEKEGEPETVYVQLTELHQNAGAEVDGVELFVKLANAEGGSLDCFANKLSIASLVSTGEGSDEWTPGGLSNEIMSWDQTVGTLDAISAVMHILDNLTPAPTAPSPSGPGGSTS